MTGFESHDYPSSGTKIHTDEDNFLEKLTTFPDTKYLSRDALPVQDFLSKTDSYRFSLTEREKKKKKKTIERTRLFYCVINTKYAKIRIQKNPQRTKLMKQYLLSLYLR
ncbi:hypothetical protein SK128_010514 [Halocaridina rubra]|uniref:Uncharacterized protein n=1 Tax=Halocaridina rubra TaxID=373956 RepID=A0AAN9A6N2_HALRR